MNILILGSTSGIGQSVTYNFANKNRLILVGRSKKNLKLVGNIAKSFGACSIITIEYDLLDDINILFDKINNIKVDLLINMASASSKFRDSNISSDLLTNNVYIDLINPFKLSEYLKRKNNNVKIIFITSILSQVQTFNRIIYSSMKVLQEKYLSKLDCSLLIITIATKLNKKNESKKSKKLAKKIFIAHENNKKSLVFGYWGKLLKIIYYINPLLLNIFILMKRKFIKDL